MDAYNLNSQPEILYRTNPDYKNCVVGIDLWYPEKDARDVPVYDCYATFINVDPDGWGREACTRRCYFLQRVEVRSTSRGSSYSIKEYAYRRVR